MSDVTGEMNLEACPQAGKSMFSAGTNAGNDGGILHPLDGSEDSVEALWRMEFEFLVLT